MLYNKLLDGIPIKTVGIWKNESWGMHNLYPALKGIGELNYLPVPHKPSIEIFSNKIFEYVKEINPDFVYTYVRNRWVNSKPFIMIRKLLKIPVVNLSLDDTHKFNLVASIAPSFTLNQTSSKSSIIKYNKCKANAIYLPEGASLIYKEKFNFNAVKDIDVSFIGKRYGNRDRSIKAVKDLGIKVVVRGMGWPGGPVSFDEMMDIYSRSKIILGFSRTSSKSNTYSIKGRDFEVPMTGSFYLVEYNPELSNCYRKTDLVFWHTIKDLTEKVKYYLNNEKERRTISCMASFRANNYHTWNDRLAVIFKYLSESAFV